MIKNTLPETDLRLSDFHYDLPEERIAQTPAEPRDSSRLLVLNRKDGSVEHRIFRDIVEYLDPGDTLVVNDTRVIHARIGDTASCAGTDRAPRCRRIRPGRWSSFC